MQRKEISIDSVQPDSSTLFVTPLSLRKRSDWFIKLRWLSILAVLPAVLVARYLMHLSLDFSMIVVTISLIFLSNLLYHLVNRRVLARDLRFESNLIKIQMIADMVLLTVLINLTGGIENPLAFVYIFHVIIASLIFRGREIYQIAMVAILLFSFEVVAEHLGILPRFQLFDTSRAIEEPYYVAATLMAFWSVILFSAFIGASFMRHNRSIKRDLVKRQAELIEANKAKVDFFRFVTHEVKSPILTARSALDTALLKMPTDMAGTTHENLLTRANARLVQATEIVSDLAELTRWETRGRVAKERVDLTSMVARLIDNQMESIEDKKLKLATKYPARVVTCNSAPEMVEKILTNLISNAIRYNSDGGKLTVGLSEERNYAVFSVADTGIGISEEEQESIFEEFYRTADARKASMHGTGLGLPIVKKFIDKLDGEISLVSEPGKGSTFTVKLRKNT